MKYNIGLFNESFPPTIDGVANAVYNYADIITKNGGNCTVVTPKYPNVIDDYDFDVVRFSSTAISKKLGYRMGNIVPIKTLAKLKAKKFDLIHVHSPFVSSLVADELIKFCKGTPVVFTYHTKFDIEFDRRLKIKPFKDISTKFVKHNIKKADEVWVVSEGAAKSLRNIGYKGPYKVMRNGTDFEKGKSDENTIRNLKKSYNIKDDEIVFVYIGRMMWYKNIGLTLKALKKIPDGIKYKMLFVGDGYDRPGMEQMAKRLKIDDKCIFVGAIYDRQKLRDFYSLGDLFLFPSTYDTSGLVVMEAAATALPALLVKGSCASEGIKNNHNGFLCEENPESMKNAILKAIADKEELKEIGLNAQNEVYRSWEDAVKDAYERYEQIVEEHKKHPKRIYLRKQRYKK